MPIQVERTGTLAVVKLDNPPINAIGKDVREGLLRAVQRVATMPVAAALLVSTGRSFIAGADVTEFDKPPVPPHLPDVIDAIEGCPVPWIAAIHGPALGGGLEIALGCAWRIAGPQARLGLPEVAIGIIPGAGGVERLPRLIGAEPALDMITSGQHIGAEKALDLGLIDAMAEGDLTSFAAGFVRGRTRPAPLRACPAPTFGQADRHAYRAQIAARAAGVEAPLHAFDAVMRGLDQPFEQVRSANRQVFLDLKTSPQSRALRHAFFAERAAAKPAAIAGAAPRRIDQAGVIGGGLMGAGIATSLLMADIRVTLIERDQTAAEAATARVTKLLDGAAARGKLADVSQTVSLLNTGTRMETLAGTDLVIEAVFEDLAAKQQVVRAAVEVTGPETLLATNTSYLDPMQIFDGIDRPERLLGLHFFSPAQVMKLVEVVACPGTSAQTLATGFALAKRLGKTGVLSGICDGFIGNRMLSAYRRAADYTLEDGALPHQIDTAMREFGMPMGPCELQDLTGLQIAWANRKRQAATRLAAERYVRIGDLLCEAGRFGQRSGRGWYSYAEGSRKPQPDPEVEALILAEAARNGITRRSFKPKQIQSRLLAAMINEGALILDEGIAARPLDIDTVKMLGYGFPRWRGGPMHHADAIGAERILYDMEALAAAAPGSWRIATSLRRAAEGEPFASLN
ncbi:MAG: FAD-dependent oxidoreductase [Pseudomonadota bacterium]